jgi:predicted O-methyltransferase YrrM
MKKYTEEELVTIWETCKDKYTIQQKKNEWLCVLRTINEMEDVKNILEIGAFDGGSSYGLKHFAENMVTMDFIPTCRFDQTPFGELNWTYLGGDSHDPNFKQQASDFLGGVVDVLMIDGDHTHDGSLQDYNDYKHLVRKGGIIIFHDIMDTESHREQGCFVHDTWSDVKKQHDKYTECIELEGEIRVVGNPAKPELMDNTTWGGVGIVVI